MTDDHYAVLGVTPDAPKEVVKAAVSALQKRWHPDRNPGNPEAHVKMSAINHAASVLLDDDKRAAYDRDRKGAPEAPPSGSATGTGPGPQSFPDPEPAAAEFGVLRPGQTSTVLITVYALGSAPKSIRVDPVSGTSWRSRQLNLDGELVLEVVVNIPAGAAPGEFEQAVLVSFDSNVVAIPIRWKVAAKPASSSGARPATAGTSGARRTSSPPPRRSTPPPRTTTTVPALRTPATSPATRPAFATTARATTRRKPSGLRWLFLLAYVLVGEGLLLMFERQAVTGTYAGQVFMNGLVTFIGWVGPLPFGILGGVIIGRLVSDSANGFVASLPYIGGGLLFAGAASLSIWQAFW
jgi:curved DNA-binding protein CbpA